MTITGIPKAPSKATIAAFFRDLGALGVGEYENCCVKGAARKVRVAVPTGSGFEKQLAERSAELEIHSTEKKRPRLAVIERDGLPEEERRLVSSNSELERKFSNF